MNNNYNIQPITLETIDEFLDYLDVHIAENGFGDTPLFIPLSRRDRKIPAKVKESFKSGQSIKVGTIGWRRVFVARNNNNEIVGHIDLKSHDQKHTLHRAVLGMGILNKHRRRGIGSLLMNKVTEWSMEHSLSFIDLNVLSTNIPAIGLYKKLAFKVTGETEDQFRIDGESLGSIMMSKKLTP